MESKKRIVLVTEEQYAEQLLMLEIMDQIDRSLTVKVVNSAQQLYRLMRPEIQPIAPGLLLLKHPFAGLSGFFWLEELNRLRHWQMVPKVVWGHDWSISLIEKFKMAGSEIYFERPTAPSEIKSTLVEIVRLAL